MASLLCAEMSASHIKNVLVVILPCKSKSKASLTLSRSGVCPGASRQFVASRRTGAIRDRIRMRSYIPGNPTDQTGFGAKFIPVSPGYATVCDGTFPV